MCLECISSQAPSEDSVGSSGLLRNPPYCSFENKKNRSNYHRCRQQRHFIRSGHVEKRMNKMCRRNRTCQTLAEAGARTSQLGTTVIHPQEKSRSTTCSGGGGAGTCDDG